MIVLAVGLITLTTVYAAWLSQQSDERPEPSGHTGGGSLVYFGGGMFIAGPHRNSYDEAFRPLGSYGTTTGRAGYTRRRG